MSKNLSQKLSGIRIFTIRNQRVVLDSDLAAIYGVSAKRLNEQFRRNRHRFPRDFAFQLTAEEFEILRSQIATLENKTAKPDVSQTVTASGLRSQIATLKLGRGEHRKYRPWAFTEHGALQSRTFCAANARLP